jgi:peptidoglycan/LPS O-acetylase OafA/YrhL
MALHHRSPHREVAPTDGTQPPYATAFDDRVSMRWSDGLSVTVRAIAAIAAGIALVFAVVALIRIDWTDGLDSPAVEVAGLGFTPEVAIGTLVLGLVALAAGASSDRASMIGVGAPLACVGLAILLAGDSRADWSLETAHGWMALLVGVVLLVAGLAMRDHWSARRTVSEGPRRP